MPRKRQPGCRTPKKSKLRLARGDWPSGAANLALSGLDAEVSPQAERFGIFAHRDNAKSDVLFNRHTKFRRSIADIVTRNAFSKSLVLQFLFHRIHFQIQNTLRWPHVATGGDEASQFVASEERVLERCLARNAAIIRVGNDRPNDLFGVAVFAQDLGTFGRMTLVGRVFGVGPALVVEIV